MSHWNEELKKAAKRAADLQKTEAEIRKSGPAAKPYCVHSKDGKKKFGCYKTRKEAETRLRQIEFFKHKEK